MNNYPNIKKEILKFYHAGPYTAEELLEKYNLHVPLREDYYFLLNLTPYGSTLDYTTKNGLDDFLIGSDISSFEINKKGMDKLINELFLNKKDVNV